MKKITMSDREIQEECEKMGIRFVNVSYGLLSTDRIPFTAFKDLIQIAEKTILGKVILDLKELQ